MAGEVVAIDGKTLRGSFDTAAGKNPLHLVSRWACDARLTLGQVAVDTKSNEITAIPLLLELLDLKGCIVTIDAMGCQKEFASAIRGRDADDVLAVSDNQPSLHQAVQEAFLAYAEDGFTDPTLKQLKRRERGHGREETREYFIAAAPAALVDGGLWQDLSSIGMVSRTRVVDGVESNSTVSHPTALVVNACGLCWSWTTFLYMRSRLSHSRWKTGIEAQDDFAGHFWGGKRLCTTVARSSWQPTSYIDP